MKKLIILALMALLAGGVTFAEVTFGGFIEYETASSLDAGDKAAANDGANYGRYDGDIRLIANIKADEYNTGVIRVRQAGANRSNLMIDNAHATTDVGKLFSLPIGWKSQIGLNEWAFAPVGNLKWDTLHRILQRASDYDYDATKAPEGNDGNHTTYYFDTKIWGLKESFVFQDVFTLNAFFSLNGSSVDTASNGQSGNDWGYSKLRDFYIDGVFSQAAGPGKLSIEVAYMLFTSGLSNGATGAAPAGTNSAVRPWDDLEKNYGFGDGTLLLALGYGGFKLQDDLSLDLGAAYYLPLSKASPSAYGVNAQLNVGKLAYVLVGLQGYPDANEDSGWGAKDGTYKSKEDGRLFKGEILHNIRIGAGVTPVEFLSIDAGVLLYMGNDKIYDKDGTAAANLQDRELLNTLDISAALKMGKAEYRLGYLFVPDNDISIDPFAGGDNNVEIVRKALYFKARISF